MAVGGSVVGKGARCMVNGEVADGLMKLVFMMGEVGLEIWEGLETRGLAEPMLLRCVANLDRCALSMVWYGSLAAIARVASVLMSLRSLRWRPPPPAHYMLS